MSDQKPEKVGLLGAVYRHLAGTAMIMSGGAAIGAAFQAIKSARAKQSITATALKGGGRSGAFIGLLTSLGFGRMFYESVFKPKHHSAPEETQAAQPSAAIAAESEIATEAQRASFTEKLNAEKEAPHASMTR